MSTFEIPEEMRATAFGLRQRQSVDYYGNGDGDGEAEPERPRKASVVPIGSGSEASVNDSDGLNGFTAEEISKWKMAEKLKQDVAMSARTVSFSAWMPEDDSLLCDVVPHIMDFHKIHKQVRFSQRFSIQEIMKRWHSLLYDDDLKDTRLSTQVQKRKRPWTKMEEEKLLELAPYGGTLADFQKIIELHRDTFDPTRTGKSLEAHLRQMKRKNQIPDGLTPGFVSNGISQTQNQSKRRKKSKAPVLYRVSNADGTIVIPVHDALSVWGRPAPNIELSVDLSQLGDAHKVSREHCLISKQPNGKYLMRNVGKRKIMMNGTTIAPNGETALPTGSDPSSSECACIVDVAGISVHVHFENPA